MRLYVLYNNDTFREFHLPRDCKPSRAQSRAAKLTEIHYIQTAPQGMGGWAGVFEYSKTLSWLPLTRRTRTDTVDGNPEFQITRLIFGITHSQIVDSPQTYMCKQRGKQLYDDNDSPGKKTLRRPFV